MNAYHFSLIPMLHVGRGKAYHSPWLGHCEHLLSTWF